MGFMIILQIVGSLRYNFKPTNLQCFIGIQELNDIWKKRSM